jgi:hypothetical protein
VAAHGETGSGGSGGLSIGRETKASGPIQAVGLRLVGRLGRMIRWKRKEIEAGRKKGTGQKQKMGCRIVFKFKQGFLCFKIKRFKYFQTKFELEPNYYKFK